MGQVHSLSVKPYIVLMTADNQSKTSTCISDGHGVLHPICWTGEWVMVTNQALTTAFCSTFLPDDTLNSQQQQEEVMKWADDDWAHSEDSEDRVFQHYKA